MDDNKAVMASKNMTWDSKKWMEQLCSFNETDLMEDLLPALRKLDNIVSFHCTMSINFYN